MPADYRNASARFAHAAGPRNTNLIISHTFPRRSTSLNFTLCVGVVYSPELSITTYKQNISTAVSTKRFFGAGLS
jgi:hypothetical protein